MGGKSSSSSANSTTTNNTYQTNNEDNRMTIGNGGYGLSGTGNNISTSSSTVNNVLDGGAIAGAIDLAKNGRDLASQEFGQVLNAGKWMVEQAYKNASDSRAEARETIKDVGGIYQQSRETELSKDGQTAKQLMTVGGMILVGVIAVKTLK